MCPCFLSFFNFLMIIKCKNKLSDPNPDPANLKKWKLILIQTVPVPQDPEQVTQILTNFTVLVYETQLILKI